MVLVTGIAGSGKTSVALGRTKALCDRRFSHPDSEEWDDFFEPSRAVGFVLNGQLIDYLKETRDTLHLHQMPVKEYDELRQTLVRQRAELLKVRLSPKDAGVFTRVGVPTDPVLGSVAALMVADQLIARAYADEIDLQLDTVPNPASPGTSVLRAAWADAWTKAFAGCQQLALRLRRAETGSRFACRGLAEQIDDVLRNARRGVDGLWASVAADGVAIRWDRVADVVQSLHAAGFEFKQGHGTEDTDTLRVTSQQVSELCENVEELRAKFQLDVPLSSTDSDRITRLLEQGDLVDISHGRPHPIQWEQFTLERETRAGRVWIRKRGSNDKWKLLRPLDLTKAVDNGAELRKLEGYVRKTLIEPLRLPILLLGALEATGADPLIDPAMCEGLSSLTRRLKEKKLADSDIDMFIALAHVVVEGYEGNVLYLQPPRYFDSVFIDEVQDFSEIQVFLMAAHADPRRKAVTVVGDFCQQLSSTAAQNVESCFPDFPAAQIKRVFLDRNKRQEETPALASFSAWFRHAVLKDSELIADTEMPRPDRGALSIDITPVSNANDLIKRYLGHLLPDESVAVICPSESIAQHLEMELRDVVESHFRKSAYSTDHRDLTKLYYVHFTTPQAAKGLEFDVVVAPHFEHYDFSDRLQLNSAYVAITRAKRRLHVLAETDPFHWYHQLAS